MDKWIRINYQPNLPLRDGKYVTSSEEHIFLSRTAAEEGMVLLKNQDALLPLATGGKVCLFGKGTFDYVKGGGGSGNGVAAKGRTVGSCRENVFCFF